MPALELPEGPLNPLTSQPQPTIVTSPLLEPLIKQQTQSKPQPQGQTKPYNDRIVYPEPLQSQALPVFQQEAPESLGYGVPAIQGPNQLVVTFQPKLQPQSQDLSDALTEALSEAFTEALSQPQTLYQPPPQSPPLLQLQPQPQPQPEYVAQPQPEYFTPQPQPEYFTQPQPQSEYFTQPQPQPEYFIQASSQPQLASSVAQPPAASSPFLQCPSAMKCVERRLCDFNGVMRPQETRLTPEQELLRVPLIVSSASLPSW